MAKEYENVYTAEFAAPISQSAAKKIKDEDYTVSFYTRVHNKTVNRLGKEQKQGAFYYVDSDYFKIFSKLLITGSFKSTGKNCALISKSTAITLFSSTDCIGEEFYEGDTPYIVGGVYDMKLLSEIGATESFAVYITADYHKQNPPSGVAILDSLGGNSGIREVQLEKFVRDNFGETAGFVSLHRKWQELGALNMGFYLMMWTVALIFFIVFVRQRLSCCLNIVLLKRRELNFREFLVNYWRELLALSMGIGLAVLCTVAIGYTLPESILINPAVMPDNFWDIPGWINGMQGAMIKENNLLPSRAVNFIAFVKTILIHANALAVAALIALAAMTKSVTAKSLRP